MKILKWIMKAVVALVTIITLIVLFADDLAHTYNKLTWTPPMEINGITIGMTRSDVVFKLGEPKLCSEDKTACTWGDVGEFHTVIFKDELVDYQNVQKPRQHLSIPFKNTADMKALLGDEDLLAESKDFIVRRYTYLKWGTTFKFENDTLTEYMVGKVRWRSIHPLGKYVIKGTVVCPSADCPYDDQDDLKEGFKDRDYTYFIK
jgi:outer membrane protein assembly factor BamE (lipoprotein component of BamABCDE complex)